MSNIRQDFLIFVHFSREAEENYFCPFATILLLTPLLWILSKLGILKPWILGEHQVLNSRTVGNNLKSKVTHKLTFSLEAWALMFMVNLVEICEVSECLWWSDLFPPAGMQELGVIYVLHHRLTEMMQPYLIQDSVCNRRNTNHYQGGIPLTQTKVFLKQQVP